MHRIRHTPLIFVCFTTVKSFQYSKSLREFIVVFQQHNILAKNDTKPAPNERVDYSMTK